jgi:hypothetical protein
MGDKRGFTSVVYWGSQDPEREFPGVTVEVEKPFTELSDEEQTSFGQELARLSVLGGIFLDPVVMLRGLSRTAVWWKNGEGGAHAVGTEEVVSKQFRKTLAELHDSMA